AVAHLDLAVGDVRVAEADVLGGGAAVAADVLRLDLAVGHADGGPDEGVELGLAAAVADLVLEDADLLRRRLLDELRERVPVHAALPVAEELDDEGVRVRPREGGLDLSVGDLDPEPLHLRLAEAVLD